MASTFGTHRFFDDLVRVETRLYNAVGERLRAEHGLAASQFEFLRYLRDHPESRVAEIATTFAAGVGAISKGVDRLQARGWAVRIPSPTDGRSSLVSLSAQGATLLADAEQTFAAAMDELIGRTVTAEQVASAGEALATIRRALEQARIGMPVG